MPIWKVTREDGMYQVADADGALYPLTMEGEPVTRFNEGWLPRGLQTGMPPFHVLELEHTSGDSTLWLHDETLDYKANAVAGLKPDELDRFMAVMEPIVRTLYAECVLAPQAAIPAAAHQFDGMLPRTIALLTDPAIRRTMPATDVVILDQLQELKAGYGNGTDALSAEWIAAAIDAPSGKAQERFDLPGRRCDRHVDPATGLVFYVMRSDDPAETSLFVPQRRVVFFRSRHTHDPLSLLLHYYAGHTDRAVALPEALDLTPDMVVPPQHGLDEPPAPEPEPTPVSVQAPVPAPVPQEPEHEHGGGHELGHEAGRTVFEAPLAETPDSHYAAMDDETVRELEPPAAREPVPAPSVSGYRGDAVRPDDRPSIAANTAPPPKQNWWQRLLGLGNP